LKLAISPTNIGTGPKPGGLSSGGKNRLVIEMTERETRLELATLSLESMPDQPDSIPARRRGMRIKICARGYDH